MAEEKQTKPRQHNELQKVKKERDQLKADNKMKENLINELLRDLRALSSSIDAAYSNKEALVRHYNVQQGEQKAPPQ